MSEQNKNEYKLLIGDCVEQLRELPDNSVDAVVTDPPYGLSKQPDMAEVMRHWLNGDDYEHKGAGFMGKSWDSFVPGPSVWRECFRVLKPGGHLLAFFGSRTYDIGTLAIRLAGFEIRDQIMWVYATGFPKSLNVSKAISTEVAKQWQGWGTALKPAHEPIVMARKPISGTVAVNVLEHGTGAINVDGCRIGFQNQSDKNSAKPQGKATYSSGKLAGKAQETFRIVKESGDETLYWSNEDGWVDKDSSTIFSDKECRMPLDYTGIEEVSERKKSVVEQNPLGRFPANFIHDGSDEVVELFPDSKGSGPARVLKRSHKSEQEGWGMNTISGDEVALPDAGSGSAARFFYCAKASKRDRDEGLAEFDEKSAGELTGGRKEGSADLNNPRAGAGRTSSGRKNVHPTVKPTDLMRYLVRMVTPPNGTVLDPFTGSGSTGKACMLEGFNFVGCELSEEYAEIAKARIEHAKNSSEESSTNTDTTSDSLSADLFDWGSDTEAK